MTLDLDLGTLQGLSEQEAAGKLRTNGPNELPTSRPRSLLAIVFDVVREPMFLLLVGCGALYLLLGDVEEAILLLGFVFVVMGITFYQERKTERALEALRDLSSPRALVLRDKQQRRIPGREVVRGDVVILAEGDRVPADGVLLASVSFAADEALLTGESAPVRKMASPGTEALGRPGGDDLPFVWSGTLVIQGRGVYRVLATGADTELGKIGRALRILQPEDTPLQQETQRLVGRLAVAGLALCFLVVLIHGLARHDWLRGLLAGITLAMATLPEEFPVVLTVFLALGAWRLSRQQVLTRRVPAVEALGATTVLCVDKTGTLTLNRMAVRKLFADGAVYDVAGQPLPEPFHEVVEYCILASRPDPFDPMEKAFHQLGADHLARTEHIHHDWELLREYPLSPGLLAMSQVWRSREGQDYVIAAKGAPEAIADLCHLGVALTERLTHQVTALADEGLRVLAVAKALFRPAALPGEQHDFAFTFVGLVGLEDPVRPGVPAAVAECYDAGMRVLMITGDYPNTARSIARQIGLPSADEWITGTELDTLSDAELQRRIRSVNIFARAVPEQKLRLVNALKANGEIVAMTGDGVNDAPALKAAHVGIAMGGRGTDVAREAAALVLLDDDFASIVLAVRQGRRIFDNLRKAMAYIVAIHVPVAGMSLFPVLLGWPPVLTPVHIVFLELIIDPACSVVFEAESAEADVMQRPPRDPRQALFGTRMLALGLLQGLCVLAVLLAVFGVAWYRGQGELDARALTFTTLIVANLGLILVNRSWTRTIAGSLRTSNRALWWVLGGALLFLACVLYVPFLRDLFRFSTLHPDDLALCLGAGVASVLWFELFKLFRQRR